MNAMNNAPKTARQGVCNYIHHLLDTAVGEVTSKHIPRIAKETGFSETTVRIQFYCWKQKRANAAKVPAQH